MALLEYPTQQERWWQSGLIELSTSITDVADIENFGILDDRDDMARLSTYLDAHPVQVLLGIHFKALPDRGTLRKLDQIASHAKHGLIVQLLNDSSPKESDVNNAVLDGNILEPLDASSSLEKRNVRYQQWQTALSARNIGLINN